MESSAITSTNSLPLSHLTTLKSNQTIESHSFTLESSPMWSEPNYTTDSSPTISSSEDTSSTESYLTLLRHHRETYTERRHRTQSAYEAAQAEHQTLMKQLERTRAITQTLRYAVESKESDLKTLALLKAKLAATPTSQPPSQLFRRKSFSKTS